jgi:hypothetical protein
VWSREKTPRSSIRTLKVSDKLQEKMLSRKSKSLMTKGLFSDKRLLRAIKSYKKKRSIPDRK